MESVVEAVVMAILESIGDALAAVYWWARRKD
jgi:hypothetical protein